MQNNTNHWKLFEDPSCPWCGSSPEIWTNEPDYLFGDDNSGRCTECGCPCSVVVDEDSASLSWHDEPGCQCDWCRSHPVCPQCGLPGIWDPHDGWGCNRCEIGFRGDPPK